MDAETLAIGPVILVDDDDLDAALAKACFYKAGVAAPFLRFSSGMAFLEHLEGVRQGSVAMPSAILLDLNMPGINGYALLSRLRATDDFRTQPPVAIVSHSNDPRDQAKCLSLGASRYFTKPSDIEDYIAFFGEFAH